MSPDELIDEVAGASTLIPKLADWRRQGCQSLSLALPIEGDPMGLGGPAEFTTAAIEAGEAVVALGLDVGLIADGDPVSWHLARAHRGVVPDVAEADRGLRAAFVTVAGRLAKMDVARWRPEVADALMNLRHRPALDHPASAPPRCVDLAARGLQALGIVQLALGDDGAAVSASEIGARREALRDLERAGRCAVVAACSPEVWPPAQPAAAPGSPAR